jgi:hypothetical protein
MHKVKLLGLLVLALFSFGAFAATGAYAEEEKQKEEENKPQLLVLTGEGKEIKGTLTGENAELIQLSGEKTIKATKAEAKLENCENLSTNPKDTNLCKDVPLIFTGVKQGEAACRSENNKGEKAAVETVSTLLDIHIGAGLNAAKKLIPILFAKALGSALEEEIKLACGLVKIQVLGGTEKEPKGSPVLGCELLPGLENITVVEVTCKVNTTTHDAELPTCSVLCTDLGTPGFFADLDGKTFKDASESIKLKGTLNKDVFIDD